MQKEVGWEESGHGGASFYVTLSGPLAICCSGKNLESAMPEADSTRPSCATTWPVTKPLLTVPNPHGLSRIRKLKLVHRVIVRVK